MLSYALPSYYQTRYGLQGLGAFEIPTDFSCASDGKFYICRPRRTEVAQQVVAMQKAIDAFLTRLPIFRATEIPVVVNPIGTSKSGYDGRVGPVTSGVGEVALIGAAEMQRAAGEGDPPGDVIIAMRDFTAEKQRTENFAKFSASIANYLNGMATRFDEVMAKIQARRSAENQPVFVAPPPIPVPEDIKKEVKKPRISKGLLIGGSVAAAALIGLAAYGMRDKTDEDHEARAKLPARGGKKSAGAFMGHRRRR
jgi:hypothetical protein